MTFAALVLVLSQYPQHRSFDVPNLRSYASSSAVATPDYFSFLPASGLGIPVAEDLCPALAAEVPTWSQAVDGGAGSWCLGGDGQEVAGSQVDFYPDAGTTTMTVCPSGPDCASKTALVTGNGGNSTAVAAAASGTGPFTACWLGSISATPQKVLLSHATAFSTGGVSWLIEHIESSNVKMYVSNGSAYINSNLTGQILGGPSLLCLSHGGGSSPARSYWDGVAGTASASGARQSVTAKPTLDGVNGATYLLGGTSALGAFYVDQQLSAAQILAISHRVLADVPMANLRGSPVVPVSYSRTGLSFCARSDSTGSIIGPNRPCIAGGALLQEAAATNLLYRSEDFDSSYWIKVGSPVTKNYGIAPDGTKSADRFEVGAGGVNTIIQSQTVTVGEKTLSLYVKGVSGSGSLPFCMWISSAYTCSSCAYNSSSYARCSMTGTTSSDARALIGNHPSTNAHDVLIWGAQLEAGAVATSYIPTEGATATRGDSKAVATISTPEIAMNLASVAITFRQTSNGFGFPNVIRTAGVGENEDTSGKGFWLYSPGSSGAAFRAFVGNSAASITYISPLAAWPIGSSVRFVGVFDGTYGSAYKGGVLLQAPAALAAGTYGPVKYIGLGSQTTTTTYPAGGWISNVCLDSSPSRCR